MGRRAAIVTELFTVLALVLVNASLAAAEVAVAAVRRVRLEELLAEDRRGAAAIRALKEDPERFLATVQIGVTVVGATAAAYGGASIAAHLAPRLTDVGWIDGRAGGVTLALVIAGISYLSIVLGTLVPRSLALRGSERYALFAAGPLLALSWLAMPLVWIFRATANVVLRPLGRRTTFTETRHSTEELQELLEEASRAGAIHPEAGEIASRALELPGLTAADVMVPRQDVVAIPRHAKPEDLRRILLEHTHTRMPVYEDRIDNIIGYISVKDMLSVAWDQNLVVLEDLIRLPYFVPRTKQAVELLKEMRGQRRPFAIVVDEQGGMSGIVTMEDLLEELVGKIMSERAREVPQLIQEERDGVAVVSGMTPIRDVNRALDIELPEEKSFTTVGGLCLALAGRIPEPGATLRTARGIVLEVLDASARRVRTVRIRSTRAAVERAAK